MNDRPNNTAFENVETPLGPIRVAFYCSSGPEPGHGRLHATVTSDDLTVNRVPIQIREEFAASTDLELGMDNPEAWKGLYTGGSSILRKDKLLSSGSDVSDAAKGKTRTACREAIANLFTEHPGLVYRIIRDSLAVNLWYLNNKVAEKQAELDELKVVQTADTERLAEMELMLEPSPLDLADEMVCTDEANKLFKLGIYAEEG